MVRRMAGSVVSRCSHAPAWRKGGRVKRVEPNAIVRGRLVNVFLPAVTLRDPEAGLHLLPQDLDPGSAFTILQSSLARPRSYSG
jgi:hypothetical protein